MADQSDKAKLEQLSASVSQSLAEIQRIAGRQNITEARFTFPRGYIRTTKETRSRVALSYGLLDESKIRNICYSLQMADLLRWIAIRTDLSGMLLSQVVKEYICIHGHAIDYLLEATCRELSLVTEEKPKPFRKRSSLLVAGRHIRPETKKQIDWIWDVRCREHPDKLDESETDVYKRVDADRARKGFEVFSEQAGHAIVTSMFDVVEE